MRGTALGDDLAPDSAGFARLPELPPRSPVE